MPIYEYVCGTCGARFEHLILGAPEDVACQACGSRSVRRVVSVFAVGRQEAAGDVAPCGPGCCRLQSATAPSGTAG